MNRRSLLKLGAWTAGAALLPFGRNGWAAGFEPDSSAQRIVVILLRGAVDGLNVVVPYGEHAYYQARPRIAIAAPGKDGGALRLDDRFGLHPALAPLLPYWHDRSLAFVHATGSPNPSRSHFEAQDYIESGTPGVATTTDGWMNRLLGELPGKPASTAAISLGNTQPKILSGGNPVANIALGRAAARKLATDRPLAGAEFDQLYAGGDVVSSVYRQGRVSRSEMLEDLGTQDHSDPKADADAPSAQGFADDARQLARIMTRDHKLRLAFLALGGWDTHVNQGNASGQLARRLKPLGEGLAVLAQSLGASLSNTSIVVMSEFGRTVHENGNGGTDHGHGNAMWLLGGGIGGGKVYGQWPGLETAALHEGRDLAVTTDFRSVLGSLCQNRLKLGNEAMARVFPSAPAATRSLDGLLG